MGVLAAGALLFAPGAANAAVQQAAGGNNGLGNGILLHAPGESPTNVCGSSLAFLGGPSSQAICADDVWGDLGHQSGTKNRKRETSQGHRDEQGSRGHRDDRGSRGHRDDRGGRANGILNGTRFFAPTDVRNSACGHSLGALGSTHSAAACSISTRSRSFGGILGDFGDHGHGRPGHDHGHGLPGHDHGHGRPGHSSKDCDRVDHDKNKSDRKNDKDKNDKSKDKDQSKDKNKADGGVKDDRNKPGYKKPTAAKPVAEEPTTGSATKADGGRTTESLPVSGLTEKVGGVGNLGLLNKLR
ncbi:MAG TPA: hypothetical protein VFG35_12335 [Actinoplanes sp.]|nr:hypothetical protein [Actinoplanes sp.]